MPLPAFKLTDRKEAHVPSRLEGQQAADGEARDIFGRADARPIVEGLLGEAASVGRWPGRGEQKVSIGEGVEEGSGEAAEIAETKIETARRSKRKMVSGGDIALQQSWWKGEVRDCRDAGGGEFQQQFAGSKTEFCYSLHGSGAL